ncbi:PIN domain-like protein [Corynespora cassiicola Philippines]|uniref:PIN domain-like protein n=1 Tax=Corynespora cassiicola Philippines TaxID=1448308 RepID=A0A2T2NLN4_CORCC|nr:PIN domain-like protein [Corynespora cassiicola Philippines]
MGIPALWDMIKAEEGTIPLAQLAEEHYNQHERPLRIAVDEADWRFNNLTSQQVYLIRQKSNEPAFQGIEKAVFWRICRLLTYNVQLLFVFDGPSRPWKRGRIGGSRIDYGSLRLLKEMLRHFRIPYHEAPGESEAECARLQQLGIVDAVWSQDSDTLMFGCSLLIRDDRVSKQKGSTDRSKENTKKSGTSVRVIRRADIVRQHGFDREGLVLFAMLCGGDYDTKGLEKCGPTLAIQAVKAGLGTSLCRCRTKQDCVDWREQFVSWMPKKYHGLVPFDYPDLKTLNKYNKPTISTDDQLRNLRSLRHGWYQPIDEINLLNLTSSRFNVWGRGYMHWVGPVLLTRALANPDAVRHEGNPYDVKITKRRAKKVADEDTERAFVQKITFSPFPLTTLSRQDFEGDRTGYWTGRTDQLFDGDHREEWEAFPNHLLRKYLPAEVLDPPASEPKNRRKRKLEMTDHNEESPKQARGPKKRRAKAGQPIPEIESDKPATRGITLSSTSVVDLVSDDEALPAQINSRKATHSGVSDIKSDFDDFGAIERLEKAETFITVSNFRATKIIARHSNAGDNPAWPFSSPLSMQAGQRLQTHKQHGSSPFESPFRKPGHQSTPVTSKARAGTLHEHHVAQPTSPSADAASIRSTRLKHFNNHTHDDITIRSSSSSSIATKLTTIQNASKSTPRSTRNLEEVEMIDLT